MHPSTVLDVAAVVTLALTLSSVLVTAARPLLDLEPPTTTSRPNNNIKTLAARLTVADTDNSSSNCWESLFQLQSCTSEVILFFLNGETYLGPDCCHAIHIIEHHCWPSMLGSLGFTSQEGDVLRGYCDDASNSSSAHLHPPPPDAAAEDFPTVNINQNLVHAP